MSDGDRPRLRVLRGGSVPVRYKVVELSTVTDQEIESTINRWVGEGWHFDGVQFAMRESSKRPAMAFVTFTREEEPAG